MGFARDLRFAARQLKAAPGYTLAAVATLALAIGASTAIFSAVYAVLLKPMPIREPGQLAVAWGFSAAQNIRQVELSYLDIKDVADATARVGTVASVGSSAWNTVLDGEAHLRVVRHRHRRARAGGHSASRRSCHRRTGVAVQRLGHGTGHAAVRGGADSPCQRRQSG